MTHHIRLFRDGFRSFALLVACAVFACDARPAMAATLAERLGYQPTDRLLIVNGDDAGMCHAANVATIEALEKGLMTSATMMVPCPWFNEMAEYGRSHPKADLGLHLCHTSEWGKYRWGPVSSRHEVPGLVDPDGYLWKSIEQVYAHSSPQEALKEARAQVQKALKAGIDVTHLDSHMGTLQYRADYMESYLALAVEFDLPVRMASRATLERFGQPEWRDRFSSKGILFPDYFVFDELSEEKKGVKNFWMQVLRNLKPGITELYIHAALATDELKAITGSWRTRSEEHDVFTNDPDVRRLVESEKIILIGFRPLRDLQRKERAAQTR